MRVLKKVSFAKKLQLFFANELVKFGIAGFICVIVGATLSYIVEVGKPDSQIKSWSEALWMSVVTFTTTGYGDRVPLTGAGRLTMVFMMISGIVVVGLLTGQVASILVQRNLEKARGFVNMDKKKNHFIICGWKKDMEKVVEQILTRNEELSPEDIVIIANLTDDQLLNIKQLPIFKSIQILKGDYFNESMLIRANVNSAAKVLILADDNRQVSPTEVDSRTVMTAMTIENIAKNTYVVAELIDKKFEDYLEMAKVDEIILSREYGRSLIANACLSSGVAHVVHDLLDVTCSTSITTRAIPKSLIGKSFHEVAQHYKTKDSSILIGILENTGNVFKMKHEAIKEAQKNPDISKIVSSLKETKSIVSNRPVLNPADDYVIRAYCSAILIETLHPETTA